MVTIELPDEQSGWLRDVDTTEVYKEADLPTEESRENSAGGSGNSYSAAELESIHMEMWDRVIATDETDRHLFSLAESSVPEFVKEHIRDAIFSGSVFSDIQSIPSSQLNNLRMNLLDSLEQDGFTIDSVADQLQTNIDGLESREQAELIARTETAATLNKSREAGYKELDEEANFKWVSANDDRRTDACEWLTEQTNPSEGGTPVSMERLKELIDEAPEHDDEMQDDLARPDDFIVHPNERSSWVRHVE